MKRDPAATRATREAVQRAAARVGDVGHVPRVAPLDRTVFSAFARGGVPFVIVGLVEHWPLAKLTRAALRQRFGNLRVTVRYGDYVQDAFTTRRCEAEQTLGAYLDALEAPASGLPPYVGNQELPQLDGSCRWPPYFVRCGTPRIWLGPAEATTPLHCDYIDNLFAQVWGRKRFLLCAPHHHAALRTREANPVLFASTFDPQAPDFARIPSARWIPWVECVLAPGELLFLPAGWFHHVRALDLSLSVNRWSYDTPTALNTIVDGNRIQGVEASGQPNREAFA